MKNLVETGLMWYETVVSFCPSLIAAAAVYTAMHTYPFKHQSCRECANLLVRFQLAAKETPRSSSEVFKYSKRCCCSLATC